MRIEKTVRIVAGTVIVSTENGKKYETILKYNGLGMTIARKESGKLTVDTYPGTWRKIYARGKNKSPKIAFYSTIPLPPIVYAYFQKKYILGIQNAGIVILSDHDDYKNILSMLGNVD